MYLAEEEAKKKECPMARFNCISTNCITSKCMAWRWLDFESCRGVDDTCKPCDCGTCEARIGYCGLAGKL